MKEKFKIKINVGDMYAFLISHSYHTSQGPFSVIAACVMIGLLVLSISNGTVTSTTYILYPLLAMMFLFYVPFTLSKAAVRQVKMNPVFKNEIQYEVSDEGIAISQNESSTQIEWDMIRKVRDGRKGIYVYTGPKTAFIWPKNQLEPKTIAAIREMLKKHVILAKKNG